jgi:hypothetical protein
MALPENFITLHAEEERIRLESIALIERSPAAADHVNSVHASMALIMALNQGHEPASQEERIIQYLGLRLFNSAASCIRLGFSGYYQIALAVVRDVFETVQLLDYLTTYPEKLKEWETADKKTRMSVFGPATIRKALDERDGFSAQQRKSYYDTFSEYASHPTAAGFLLVAPTGEGQMGPFFNANYLEVVVGDLVKFMVHGASIFSHSLETQDFALLQEKVHFLEAIDEWRAKYFQAEAPSAT